MTKLLDAAMCVCDHYGDGEQAQADMRADCLARPPHLRADLLDHFTGLQKLHNSSAGFYSGFHAGFHQNGGVHVETTLPPTAPKAASMPETIVHIHCSRLCANCAHIDTGNEYQCLQLVSMVDGSAMPDNFACGDH